MARARSTRAAGSRSRSSTFPGGALIGCSAGFVNVPRIKGSHTAMKSGMLAAEACIDAVVADRAGDELGSYESTLRSSWIADELQLVKNAEPAVSKFGGTLGTICSRGSTCGCACSRSASPSR
jgi:electron-transferring-flavoprotein dehydrogenase